MAEDVHKSVIPSIALLDICRKLGVARVIFLSSGGTVYGQPLVIPTPETAPTEPITAYGINKLVIEQYLSLYDYLYDLDYRVLRVTNPFGPFQTPLKGQGVIAALISRALKKEPMEIWGDGMVVRDFIFVDDVMDALLAAAKDQSDARIFNIGSGQGHSLREVIAVIEHLLGDKLDVRFTAGRAIDVPVSIVAIDRARDVLGWVPKTPFEAGLRKTIQWWREQSSRLV
jgi:UDP-glucose 4-epimerase